MAATKPLTKHQLRKLERFINNELHGRRLLFMADTTAGLVFQNTGGEVLLAAVGAESVFTLADLTGSSIKKTARKLGAVTTSIAKAGGFDNQTTEEID